ncbi:hypothetical protein GCM10026983_07280 [Gracilibacillus alcaliphilus]
MIYFKAQEEYQPLLGISIAERRDRKKGMKTITKSVLSNDFTSNKNDAGVLLHL